LAEAILSGLSANQTEEKSTSIERPSATAGGGLRFSAKAFVPQAALQPAPCQADVFGGLGDGLEDGLLEDTEGKLGGTAGGEDGGDEVQGFGLASSEWFLPDDGSPAHTEEALGSLPPCIGVEASVDLLGMWFPDYGRQPLGALLEASGRDLWVAVEELLLMEGEEPYSSRINGPAAVAAADTSTAFDVIRRPTPGEGFARGRRPAAPSLNESEFPSLGGQGAAKPRPKEGRTTVKSAKEALLQQPCHAAWSSRQGRVESGDPQEATRRLPRFWEGSGRRGPEGHLDDDSVERAAAGGGGTALLPGGIPVVATGAALTRLYEEAREEAREHAYQRHVCFRKVCVCQMTDACQAATWPAFLSVHDTRMETQE